MLRMMAAIKLKTPGDVLDFWFGADKALLHQKAYLQQRMGLWFGGTDEFNAVQKENVELIRAAGKGELTAPEWDSPPGLLAKIILCDQFTRCAFKGTTEAFQYDPIAAASTLAIVKNDWFIPEYLPAERMFILIPLMHSEDVDNHHALDGLVSKIATDAPAEIAGLVTPTAFFKEHSDVVKRFGRFPSRNAAMGRVNTSEEEVYLADPNLPGWAKSQNPVK